MKKISILPLFFLTSIFLRAQEVHFGLNYSYGPSFNFHRVNSQPFRPGDCFAVGGFYHLETGEKSLGFRAELNWRRVSFSLQTASQTRINNEADCVELKIQCTLPLSPRSTLALGMAPRIVQHARSSVEYKQRSGGVTSEFEQEVPIPPGSINGLNTSLGLSYYYSVSRHFSLCLQADQDLMTYFSQDMLPSDFGSASESRINARLTCICAGLIYNLR